MDLLDRVMAPATDLLDRVDGILTRHGAPPEHPVWALLGQVGALPADALAQLASITPEGIRADAAPIAEFAGACRAAVAPVPAALDGRGVAAHAFSSRWGELSTAVADDHDGLAGRVSATADYLRQVAEWAEAARHDVAVELGACLGSAEAVAVREASGSGVAAGSVILAAADLAAHALGPIARAIEAGWEVRQRCAGVRAEVPIRAAAPISVDLTGHIDAR